MRTTASLLAANEPRNVVSARRNTKRARLATCVKRRAHTRPRITLRAGMPEPGRLGPLFLGLAGAAAGTAVEDDAACGAAEARAGATAGATAGRAAGAASIVAMGGVTRSIGSTGPTRPSQGMGSA